MSEIQAYWHANRDKNPGIFLAELRSARRRLGLLPSAGRVYLRVGERVVYRMVLRRTHHLLYYELRDDTVWVVSVWGAPKKGPPALSDPPV